MLPPALVSLRERLPQDLSYLAELGYELFLVEEDKVSDVVKLLGARSLLFSYINRERTLLIEFQFIKFSDEDEVVSAASILNLKNQETFTLEDYVRFKRLKPLPEFPVSDVIRAYQGLIQGELLPVVSGKIWEAVPY